MFHFFSREDTSRGLLAMWDVALAKSLCHSANSAFADPPFLAKLEHWNKTSKSLILLAKSCSTRLEHLEQILEHVA